MWDAMTADHSLLRRDLANALRVLSLDMVYKAQSGHIGLPFGMADVVTVLYEKFFKHVPTDPLWPDRDRFVLSAGHGSALLYALLHVLGYDLTTEDLMHFRQWKSRTPGHPEYHVTPGVESTTGPLGQGIANAVGMALAEQRLSQEYGDTVVNHYTYALVGDGCLMEGVSHEAMALASHWKLKKLIVLFDDNAVTIDGATSLCSSDDVCARVASYGWRVERVNGHDTTAVEHALEKARHRDDDGPFFLACSTKIGYGSPVEGTSHAHGFSLNHDQVEQTRRNLGYEDIMPFSCAPHVASRWKDIGTQHMQVYEDWNKAFAQHSVETRHRLSQKSLSLAEEQVLFSIVEEMKKAFHDSPKSMATRQASGFFLDKTYGQLPLLGGSADLAESTKTCPAPFFASDHPRRCVHYGPREHAMAAILNGVALHKGFVPYGGTFFAFSDYSRPAIRLSALMELPVVYVMTHDSIGVGEDGPTHQPIEHIASFRAMPNIHVMRPADAVETVECWHTALTSYNTPSLLCLTRQSVPFLPRKNLVEKENRCARGAYIVEEAVAPQRVTLFASGSEVSLAMAVREALEKEGYGVRVVSFPCWSLFEAQPETYRHHILQPSEDILRVAVEATSPLGWERYVGQDGIIVACHTFGSSAPQQDIFTHFGYTVDAILTKIRNRREENSLH